MQSCLRIPSILSSLRYIYILVLRFLFYAKIVVVDRGRVNWFLLVYTHEGIVYAFDQIHLILLGVSLNTDSIPVCQISFEKSELCMFEGESDLWVKFGTIERGGGGGFTM